MKGQTEQLIPLPSIVTDGWGGYQHFKDPTRQPFNVLNYPSMNCFIPSKDKIVPRLGKTILGQRATESNGDIGFGDFTYGSKESGDITPKELLEINLTDQGADTSSVKIDDTHIVSFFATSEGKGMAQVSEISENGQIDSISSLIFQDVTDDISNPEVGYNSCVQIDATHFINFWRGVRFSLPSYIYKCTYAQVFNIDPTTFEITALSTPLQINNDSVYNSCVKIDDTHILRFWGNNAETGYAGVFAIDSVTFAVTAVGGNASFSKGFYNSSKIIDANHFINFWGNSSSDGNAQVFEVNLGTWDVTAIGSPLTFDSDNDRYNSCAVIDANHFINFWVGSNNLYGYAQIFEVNLSTWAVTALSTPHLFDGTFVIKFNSCVSLEDGKSFTNFWSAGKYLKCQIFTANVVTGVIEGFLEPEVYISDIDVYSNNSAVYIGNSQVTNFTNDNIYSFSIIFSVSGATFSVPCPGKNRALWVSILVNNIGDGDQITSVTYDGVAMTQAFKIALDSDNERYFYYLINPSSNYNDLVITCDAVSQYIKIGASSYFNVVQSAPTIISSEGPTAGTSISISETPVVDESWIVAAFFGGSDYFDGLIKGADTVFRGGDTNFQMADSGAPISPAALTTLSADFDSSTDGIAFAAVMAPIGGATTKENWSIIGHKKRYTNDGGYVMEVRVTRTDDDSLRDIIEVLLPNPITGVMQWYQVTENANPLEQGITPRIYMDEFFDTNLNPVFSRRNSRLVWTNGTKTIFSWSGGVNPITEIVPGFGVRGLINKTWVSQGFNYFPQITQEEVRFIVINGRKYQVAKNGYLLSLNTKVGTFEVGDLITGSSSGATGEVVSVSGNTILLSSVVGLFTSSDNITGSISGATAKVTSSVSDAGYSTDFLFLTNTEDIDVGDYALAWIAPPNSQIVTQDTIVLADTYPNLDYCRQNKNYMYYGSFTSRQLFQSNNFNREAIETLVPGVSNFYDSLKLPTTPDYTGSTFMSFNILISNTDGADPLFSWSYVYGGNTFTGGTDIAITPGIKQTLITPYGSIGIIFNTNSLDYLFLGNSWTINASPAIGAATYLGDDRRPPAWANFYYDLPRVPGQGYIYNLPANFYTMEPQEEFMYVGDQYGQWGYIETTIGEDVSVEIVRYTPLKQVSASKPIYPYMLGHMENYIVFVTENKTLDFIGRQEFLEMPQMGYLSQPIAFDFEACSFEDGSLEYLNKMLYITSPKESTMLVYDNRSDNKYWQPLQTYVENGILSIVGNTLITHSNILNQSFNLFTGKDDDGAEYTVIARTSFSSGDKGRWKSKFSNNSFIEGYIEGNPQLIYTIFRAVNDSIGVSHVVKPVITDNPPEEAPLGESPLALNPLGSDLNINGSYFQEIYNKFKPILSYYFIALQIACTSKDHSYEILSLGVNMVVSPTANNTLFGDRKVE